MVKCSLRERLPTVSCSFWLSAMYPGTFQGVLMAIIHDMIEKTLEVFMDDFSVFGNSFENCLSRVDKMLQRCEGPIFGLRIGKESFYGNKKALCLAIKISKKKGD
ncbi:hypothetical protein Tco_1256754 [Tanacetum coccineum]